MEDFTSVPDSTSISETSLPHEQPQPVAVDVDAPDGFWSRYIRITIDLKASRDLLGKKIRSICVPRACFSAMANGS